MQSSLKKIVWVGLIISALMIVFPPTISAEAFQRGKKIDKGYDFIASALDCDKKYSGYSTDYYCANDQKINIEKILIQLACLWSILGIFAIAVKNK